MFPNSFLEKTGRLFFAQMRPFFFFSLLSAPLLVSLAILFLRNSQIEEMECGLQQAQSKSKAAFERKTKKERFLSRYSDANPYFLNQQIESLLFLQNEKKQIESLLRHPALPRKEALEERLAFLNRGENRLVFAEENIRSNERINETEEKQRHPVQMEETDLQKLLAILEDLPIGSYSPIDGCPQILIRDFKMKKIKTPLQREVLEIEMDLIKREFKKS